MDRHLHTCLMIDFYGQLLTKKQYEILDMYFNNDYSLSEISDFLGISRQAVSDNKNRAMDSLLKYEEMLGLAGRCEELNATAGNTIRLLDMLKTSSMDDEDKEIISKIRDALKKIIKEI